MKLYRYPALSSALCGIEFEYLLIDLRTGRLRDFRDLDFRQLSAQLADKPGLDDPGLAVGDMGIRSGYWYLEGDERYHPDGSFRTLAVKGVEIRTPPENGVENAIARLLEIEAQLAQRLERHGLGLAIAGLNPQHERYEFDPPLNAFETRLRAEDREYDGSEVSTLTYGPDINLSLPGWSLASSLDAARKLNYYAPYLVPFSFSSPYYAGAPWHGWSRRTWLRCACRPAVKLYCEPEIHAAQAGQSVLTRSARLPREVGRLEFKAFDAMPSVELLTACCHLLTGICLADDLRGRSEQPDLALYRRAALAAFDDRGIRDGARRLLDSTAAALDRAGDDTAAMSLLPLAHLLASRSTPAHALRASGRMYHPGGLSSTLERPRASA